MPKKARITRIQTGTERAAGQNGAPFSEQIDAYNDFVNASARRNRREEPQREAERSAKQREARELQARLDEEARERGDKTYGLALDGSGTYNPAPRWPWSRR